MNKKSKSKSKIKNKDRSISKPKKTSVTKLKTKKNASENSQRTTNKPANINLQRSNYSRTGRSRDYVVSPKAISYKKSKSDLLKSVKVMEKHGEMDSDKEHQSYESSSDNQMTNNFQYESKLKNSGMNNERQVFNRTIDNNVNNEAQIKSSGSSHSRTYSINTNNVNIFDEIKYKQLLNENEKLREEKKNYEKQKIKLAQLEEKLTGSNIVNYEEIIKLKEKIEVVEKNNESLKQSKNEYIETTQKKIILLIKVCQKYLNKIVNIVNLQTKFKSSLESKDIIFTELKSVIERFSSRISNQHLMDAIFDNMSIKEDMLEIDDSFSRNNNAAMIDVIERLENQVKTLTEKNDNLMKNRKLEVENIDELKRIRKNYNEIKSNYEDSQRTIIMQKQLIKDLESKAKILEEENRNVTLKMMNFKDKNQKYNLLKEKVLKYKSELKYKESIIEYLEKTMKSSKLYMDSSSKDKYRNSSRPNYSENPVNPDSKRLNRSLKNNFKRSEDNIVMNNKETIEEIEENELKKIQSKDSKVDRKIDNLKETLLNKISPKREHGEEKVNTEEEMEMNNENTKKNLEENENEDVNNENSFKNHVQNNKYFETENENREFYTNSDVNNSKSIILKNEINNLDQEIKSLQGKLRLMIDVKK